jgi:hypothetical protein
MKTPIFRMTILSALALFLPFHWRNSLKVFFRRFNLISSLSIRRIAYRISNILNLVDGILTLLNVVEQKNLYIEKWSFDYKKLHFQ